VVSELVSIEIPYRFVFIHRSSFLHFGHSDHCVNIKLVCANVCWKVPIESQAQLLNS